MSDDVVQVQFTIDNPTAGDEIVEALLDDRLIACGQRSSPIESRYWWRDQLDQATEWMITMKTRTDLSDSVVMRVKAMHSYVTPEVLVVPILGGNEDYIDWIVAETTPR